MKMHRSVENSSSGYQSAVIIPCVSRPSLLFFLLFYLLWPGYKTTLLRLAFCLYRWKKARLFLDLRHLGQMLHLKTQLMGQNYWPETLSPFLFKQYYDNYFFETNSLFFASCFLHLWIVKHLKLATMTAIWARCFIWKP